MNPLRRYARHLLRSRSSAASVLTLVAVAASASLLLSLLAPPLSAQPFDQRLFGEMRWRSIGPYRGGRTARRGRRPVPAERLLHRRLQRRRLEDDRLRPHLDADLRRPADRLDRRHRRRALRPEHRLRRQRRGPAAARPLDRRRHLQVDRRRQDLDAPRPARRPADPADRRRPAQPRPRCSSPCSAIPTARTRSAASSARPTAAGPSRRSSTRTRTPAAPTSPSTRSNPDIVYAALWEARQGPWENAEWHGTGGGIFKSTDGGTTWRQLDARACRRADGRRPGQHRRSRRANPRRIYAAVAARPRHGHLPLGRRGRDLDARSRRPAPAARIGGGDLPRARRRPEEPRHRLHRQRRDLEIDRRRQDLAAPSAARRAATTTRASGSTRTTRTSSCSRATRAPSSPSTAARPGAPGTTSRRRSSTTSRPTTPSPTASAAASRRAARRASRAAATTAQITFREWHPVGVDEYGYAAPDPLDPDIVYGGRSVTRYDRRTGQVQNGRPEAAPRAPTAARSAPQPVVFSPVDPHVLFFAANTLWKTRDGGQSWQQISPDLTRKTWEVPASVGKYTDDPIGEAGAARRHLHRRAVLRRHQPHLGRHRRRADPRHGRRRAALDGRDAARARRRGPRSRSSTPAASTR